MSLLATEPTKPITNEHTMGYRNESEEGDSASIKLHRGSEHVSEWQLVYRLKSINKLENMITHLKFTKRNQH
jgi:hypothetical protein